MPQIFPTGYNPTYGYGTPYPFPNQTYSPQQYTYTQPNVQNGQQAQQMTPPTIRAEIIQVENRQIVENYPVAAGCTQMFMSKDDKFIFIKTAFPNAPYELVEYEKKTKSEPVAQNQNTIDTDKFVTRDEFESRITEIMNKQKSYKHKNYDKPIPATVREDVQNG